MNKKNVANVLTHLVLQVMALCFNLFPSFKKYLKSRDGWINFSVALSTEDKRVRQAISFNNGKARVRWNAPEDVNVELVFMDTHVLGEMTKLPPNEVLNLILKNKLTVKGNLAYAQLFNFFISLLLKGKQIKMMEKQVKEQMNALCVGIPRAG